MKLPRSWKEGARPSAYVESVPRGPTWGLGTKRGTAVGGSAPHACPGTGHRAQAGGTVLVGLGAPRPAPPPGPRVLGSRSPAAGRMSLDGAVRSRCSASAPGPGLCGH